MRVNIAKPSKAYIKKNHQNRNCLGYMAHNLSKVWYCNYNKKSHYLSNYIESLKTSFDFNNLCANE